MLLYSSLSVGSFMASLLKRTLKRRYTVINALRFLHFFFYLFVVVLFLFFFVIVTVIVISEFLKRHSKAKGCNYIIIIILLLHTANISVCLFQCLSVLLSCFISLSISVYSFASIPWSVSLPVSLFLRLFATASPSQRAFISLSALLAFRPPKSYDLRDRNRRHEGGGLTVTEVSNLSQTTVSWCDHILPYFASLTAIVRVPPNRFEQVWSSSVGAL